MINAYSFFFRSTNPPIKDRLTNLKIIDEMLRVYDRRATPTNKIGTPTRVVCELFIRSFGSISEKTMVSLPNSFSRFPLPQSGRRHFWMVPFPIYLYTCVIHN